ncbi:putative anditomin synthesis protein [Botrytis fragariae]|uniref:Putative anditomin synthesis protein n=1 Tax=Botrytis fragariae TaxID=1964551 RepID=A0A8H6AYN3_9HELO|nr:putative anditomin synthesis protein [Botrytis fragariae]KAF5875907.1 putative anditomin synthesis protein [Botrytis fragariae]
MPRPRLNAFDSSEPLLRTTNAANAARRHITGFWEGFVDFAFNDNVLHVAIGLIIAQSFTALITSLVSSVLLPPLSLLPFLNKNLEEKFAVLRPGPHYDGMLHNRTEISDGIGEGVEGNATMVVNMGMEFLYGAGYNTLKQAIDDGAIVLAWGSFLNKVINFIGVGLALYGIAGLYQYFSQDNAIIKHTVRCRYCRKKIFEKAQRCVFCTSWQDGREDIRPAAATI